MLQVGDMVKYAETEGDYGIISHTESTPSGLTFYRVHWIAGSSTFIKDTTFTRFELVKVSDA